MNCSGTIGGMADGVVSWGGTGGGVAGGVWAVAGDIAKGVWKARGSGRAASCTDSESLSVEAGGGEAAVVDVGSAANGDTVGDETVVAGCWTVSALESARRLRVNGTRLRGPRAVSILEVEGNRLSIPVTARMLAAAVTPYHQRG
jgi:hypothetical protein